MTPVRERQVEDLVSVLPQRLDLHTGDAVKQAPELPVPRHSRCKTQDQELFEATLPLFSYRSPFATVMYFACPCLQTWMSGHRARYAVVAVEQLPPKELISGDSLPLSAGQTGSQHSIIRQTHEDLQHQAVWQNWDTLHPDILSHR